MSGSFVICRLSDRAPFGVTTQPPSTDPVIDQLFQSTSSSQTSNRHDLKVKPEKGVYWDQTGVPSSGLPMVSPLLLRSTPRRGLPDTCLVHGCPNADEVALRPRRRRAILHVALVSGLLGASVLPFYVSSARVTRSLSEWSRHQLSSASSGAENRPSLHK